MKRLLSYVLLLCFSMTLFCSCIFEQYGVTAEEPVIRLQLAMSSVDNLTKASQTEDGSNYENTIFGVEDVRLFVFDQTNGNYIGQATDLVLSGDNHSPLRVLEGKLPVEANNKVVKLMFMANYIKRGVNSLESNLSQGFDAWRKALIFDYDYSKKPWTSADGKGKKGKYLPMAGEDVMKIHNKGVNRGVIYVDRAIAKIRLKVRNDCKYSISSFKVENAVAKGYCLEQAQFSVPENSKGLTDRLTFTELINPKESFEFYIPEQYIAENAPEGKNTQMILEMKPFGSLDGPGQLQPAIVFKDYLNGKLDPNGHVYNIVRNNLYEFEIFKKADENKVDVQVSVMPWTTHDLNTDFE